MAQLESKLAATLKGHVALVTGASRGLGKGIAKMIAEAGATVYITGRSLGDEKSPLRSTADEINSKGGSCIPVQCDHGNDEDVDKLFRKIKIEQDGRLDILVNNAFGGVTYIMNQGKTKFYEQPIEGWDIINRVGTRSNYVAAHYAANMMIPRESGLIVNISSAGGLSYLFNIPYGIGKEANDRMAADMAIELRKKNICVVSLWPGAVVTELLQEGIKQGQKLSNAFDNAEDATYSGKAVVALANDKSMMSKSGKVLIASEMGREYGFRDIGGVQPMSPRQLRFMTAIFYPGYEWMVPGFFWIPKWLFSFAGHKL